MRLKRLTLLRANMGDYRSSDAMPPLSLAILAARTPTDVEITFYDDKVEVIPEDDQPDLMAITVETFTARRAYELADRYRRRGVTVVMGGYHPTLAPDEALEHASAIVIGDAEGSWECLLEDFRSDRLQRTYEGGNERSLDDVVADRDIFKGKKYTPVEVIQYGRGCRFACDFCSIKSFYKDSVRSRKLNSIKNELNQINKNKLVFFADDNLFGTKSELYALLEVLKRSKVRWICQISIDVARDEHLLDCIAEAGCILVLIGFESLSKANLKQMAKPWNFVSGDYPSVVNKFHQRGIAVYGTFVFGYDEDTVDSVRESLDFAIDSKLEIANFNPLTPTPGSPLYERLKTEGRLISEKWWLDPAYRYGDPIFAPKLMSPEEFSQVCFDAKKSFYSWRSIARRVLGTEAGIHWFRTGMVGLANVISRREIMKKQHRYLGVRDVEL